LSEPRRIQWIDSFCGFGGVSEGIEMARDLLKEFEVIAGINHDPKAIECYKAFVEDFRELMLSKLPAYVRDAIRCFWISAECQGHSIANGGHSRDADSRTLPEHLLRYIDYLKSIGQRLHYIYVENVREFLSWGPLIIKVKKTKEGYEYCPLIYNKKQKTLKPIWVPDPERKGEFFDRWVKEIEARGYTMEKRILNAADFGASTTRKRLFMIFASEEMPIAWPEPTHGKGLKKYKIVKNCLDRKNKGQNIFMRVDKKGLPDPLCENSLRRILTGLQKHSPKNEAFLTQYNGGSDSCRSIPLNKPCNTIPTANRFSLIHTTFLNKYYGNGDNVCSIDEPAPTLTTKDRLTKIDVQFLDQQYGQSNPASLNKPAGSLTANPKFNLITSQFLSTEYSHGTQSQSVDKPCGSLLTHPKQKLVTTEHFLYNPQWGGQYSSVDKPCFTLIARMDKMPPYLITLETGELAIEVYETDSFYTRKIKEFMAAHGIIAIYMRMLTVEELLKIQGFPKNYFHNVKDNISITNQKKFIGNAVVPVVVQKLVEALYQSLLKWYELKQAA
jgi:DNA (cytosine-5)-methyltransferase 1